MAIYYIFPDYVDELVGESKEDFMALIREGKGEIYSIDGFIEAFNDERISDLGWLGKF